MIIKYKKSVYRLTRILESLIEHNRSLSIRDIATINNCTERTVYNDISYLVENWNHLLHLDISHNNLITQNTSIGNIQFVTEQIFAKEPVTALLKLVFEKPNRTIEFYASALDISHQATRNLLFDLNESLQKYNLDLKQRSRQISIHGDEFAVRYFCAVFYYHFEHNYYLEPRKVDYDPSLVPYVQDHFVVSYFINFIVGASAIRYESGNKLNASASFSEDINQTILMLIKVLKDTRALFAEHEQTICDTFTKMGYTINHSAIDRVMMIIASILYMDTNIHAIFGTRINVVNMFVRNYSMVHPMRFSIAQNAFVDIFKPFSSNYMQIISGIIYVVDLLYPTVIKNPELNLMVYSDNGIYHCKSLQRQLEKYFPDHHFHTYFWDEKHTFPKQVAVEQFCTDYDCRGIISTLSLPYRPNAPILTVSDYFIGKDIGRIFDFINSLNGNR